MSAPTRLDEIQTWDVAGPEWRNTIKPPKNVSPLYQPNPDINKIMSIWPYGDPTKVKIDAVVNRSENNLVDGGALHQSLHSTAGPELAQACGEIGHCDPLHTVITPGFNLPAKFVIHTVGPTGNDPSELLSTFSSVLSHVNGTTIRSIGMTPFYVESNDFSLTIATQIVFQYIREILEIPENREKFDRIIFIVAQPHNFKVFIKLMYLYFPLEGNFDPDDLSSDDEEEEDVLDSDEGYDDIVFDDSDELLEHNEMGSDPEYDVHYNSSMDACSIVHQ